VAEAQARPDLETRVHNDHHQALRLWLRLLSTANMIAAELRSRLRAEFNCTMSRFDLMAQLERAPDGLTMSEVSKRLMVTNAAITGLTDRLVEEGYVERIESRADRRSSIVRLTPNGRDQFLAMARRHEAWVVELMSSLGDDRKAALRQLLGELKAGLQQN
jgi:DNA-binding MarR family transcriptional regulator